jgi:hypothetical protein
VILLPAAWVGAVAGLALYWFTAFQYTGDALSTMRELESVANPQESG